MDVARPHAAVSAGIESDVLVVLARSSKPRTGRELARLSRRSPTGVQHVLERLTGEGLVEQMEAGRAFLYTLNYDHLMAAVVEAMAAARQELVRRLRERFRSWEVPAEHASLFGSAARGDGDAASDIDILVVRPSGTDIDDDNWRAQLDELADSVRRWTGNSAGVVELARPELDSPQGIASEALHHAARDGIDLAGIPVRQLARI